MPNEDQHPKPAIKSHSNVPALVVALGIVLMLAAINFLAPTGWTKVSAEQNAKFEATSAPIIENSAPVAEPQPTAVAKPAEAIPAVPDEPLKVTAVEAETAPATTIIHSPAPVEHPLPKIRLVMGKMEKDAEGNETFKPVDWIVSGEQLAIKIELTELPDDTKAIGARVKFPGELVPVERQNPDQSFAKVKLGSIEIGWMKGYEDKEVATVYEFQQTSTYPAKELEFKTSFEWRGDTSEEHKISEDQVSTVTVGPDEATRQHTTTPVASLALIK